MVRHLEALKLVRTALNVCPIFTIRISLRYLFSSEFRMKKIERFVHFFSMKECKEIAQEMEAKLKDKEENLLKKVCKNIAAKCPSSDQTLFPRFIFNF